MSEEHYERVIDKMNSADTIVHLEMNYAPIWSWFTLVPKVWTFDASPGMENITLPAKIIWGINDGILPVALAQDAYDRLGTPAAHKSISILPNSSHWIVDEEGKDFFDIIKAFIETYSS